MSWLSVKVTFLWKQGVGGWNQVKMKSYWIRASLKPSDCCFTTKQKFGCRDMDREKMDIWTRRQRMQLGCCKSNMTRIAHNHRKLGRGKKRSHPRTFRDSMMLLTPVFQVWKLQNCKRILFVALSHLIYGVLYGRPRKLIQRVKTGRKEMWTEGEIKVR